MPVTNDLKKYICDKCGNGFRLKYNFNKHKGDCITYKKVLMMEVKNEIYKPIKK